MLLNAIERQKMLTKTVTTLTPDSIDSFRNWLLERGHSERTSKAYCSDLTVFLAEMQFEELSAIAFSENAMKWLTKNRRIVAPKTTGRRLTSLRSFAKWADWGHELDRYNAPTPAKSDPHPLPEGIPGVESLIAIARNEHQKALVALCGLCGCRVAEALEVRASSIDQEERILVVHGKGDKIRKVPISTKAWDAMEIAFLRSWTNGDTPLVGFKDRFARALITRLGEKAGLRRHISSHDLRATFATAVYDATLDIRLVQELIGHTSVETTQVYTMVNKTKMRNAVEL